jgi:hypothetical protein
MSKLGIMITYNDPVQPLIVRFLQARQFLQFFKVDNNVVSKNMVFRLLVCGMDCYYLGVGEVFVRFIRNNITKPFMIHKRRAIIPSRKNELKIKLGGWV